jgi:Nucleotidyl transferase of unknown function (DUF2204)
LLNSNGVKYLLVGGHAVAYYGHPRPTGDIDFWVAVGPQNAERLVRVFKQFGFDHPDLSAEAFLKEKQVVRVGLPPIRIEVLTTVSGLDFAECYAKRTRDLIDAVPVDILSLEHLRVNKQAAGRHKDLDDLEHLPAAEAGQ